MWKWCFDWNLSLFCLLSGVQTSVTMSLLNRTEDNISIAAWTPQSSSSSVLPPSPSSFVPQSNCSVSSSPSSPPYNFYAVLLVLLIFCVVFGNVLVCVAVSREKALQTTTNYLIVSLAVSDLLLASLVMPWGVYLEVSPHVWDLNQTAAQFYNAYVNTTSSNRSFKRHIILWNVYMSFNMFVSGCGWMEVQSDSLWCSAHAGCDDVHRQHPELMCHQHWQVTLHVSSTAQNYSH